MAFFNVHTMKMTHSVSTQTHSFLLVWGLRLESGELVEGLTVTVPAGEGPPFPGAVIVNILRVEIPDMVEVVAERQVSNDQPPSTTPPGSPPPSPPPAVPPPPGDYELAMQLAQGEEESSDGSVEDEQLQFEMELSSGYSTNSEDEVVVVIDDEERGGE